MSALLAALVLAVLPTDGAAAQRPPTEITLELGDLYTFAADGVALYGHGPPIIETHLSESQHWFVVSTRALGTSSLLFVSADGTETRCRVHVVPAGTLAQRAPVTDELDVGDELRIPSGDIIGYREGDGHTLAVRVSTDGSEIIIVGLRRGRAALLLEHRTGRLEIRQLRVVP